MQDYANLQSFNRYAYVFNNPLRYIDPTGLLTDKQIRDMLEAEQLYTDWIFFKDPLEQLKFENPGLYDILSQYDPYDPLPTLAATSGVFELVFTNYYTDHEGSLEYESESMGKGLAAEIRIYDKATGDFVSLRDLLTWTDPGKLFEWGRAEPLPTIREHLDQAKDFGKTIVTSDQARMPVGVIEMAAGTTVFVVSLWSIPATGGASTIPALYGMYGGFSIFVTGYNTWMDYTAWPELPYMPYP